MLPEQWQKLEEIFQNAADLAPDSQTVYLDQACRGDLELRQEVEALLAASPLGLIESAIAATADDFTEPESDPLVGTWLGPYRIDGLIGRGGMGAVYRAFREDDQFHKQVAIKVIPRMLAGPDVVARFRSERQILANLEHQNIARLLDGGTTEGIPYLVMEYVEGVPITQYVQAKALPLADRLRLMQSVCSAVLYAHHSLVIHRDLKPANILVTPEGTVKLLDFGVAKLTDPTVGASEHTSEMLMTPEYASPEQIRGQPVTTASDVYSLGVVLYEVLTGERPYRITSSNWLDLERVVCNTEPRRPSAVEALPSRVRRRLAGDLDNIVMMAMRKDVARRYGSAEQLSEDLRRHLQGLPIQARRDTLFYRSGKFLRRNQWAVSAAFVVAASLVTGTVIAVRQARAAQERFNQLRGFARTVLVDLNAQLIDIPGTGRARQALVQYVDDYLKRVAAEHVGDDNELATEFATTYLRLGEMQGNTAEALASFETGRVLLENKTRRGVPAPADLLLLARLRVTAGSILMDLGRNAEAVESLVAAESLANGLPRSIGWNAEAQLVKAWADSRLSRLYRLQYQLQKAEAYGREAVAVCEDMIRHRVASKEMYEILSTSRMALAGVLRRQGNWQQSMDMYHKALEENEQRAQAEPASVALQRNLSRAHLIVGDMLSRLEGNRSEVEMHVRQAIEISTGLASLDTWNKTAQNDLGQTLSSGAEMLSEVGDREEALRKLQVALPIFEALLQEEPNSGAYHLYAGLSKADIGNNMQANAEATAWIRRGLEELEKLVEREPENLTVYLEVLKVRAMLARNLAARKQEQESLSVARDLIARAREVSGKTGPTEVRQELPKAYIVMAKSCRLLGKREEALKWYQSAIDAWEGLLAGGLQSIETRQELAAAKKAAGELRLSFAKNRSLAVAAR